MTPEQIEALAPDYQYIDDDRIVVTIGFAAAFFFWNGHTAKTRQALVECVEAFEAAYGSELRWGADPESWQERKLNEKFPRLRDYVKTLDEDDCIEWLVSSGEHREAAAEYAVQCLTERGWNEGNISVLWFQVPRHLAFDAETRKTLESLLLLCHERLEPFHGHAGWTTVFPDQDTPFESDVLDLSTRYAALYVDGTTTDLTRAPFGPKGVNWLTFISDVLTERLGGPTAFVTHCQSHGVNPIRHGKGFILRAGDFPELGPVAEPLPHAYLAANAAIRSLRDGALGSMGSGSINGEVRFNRCTSDLWVRRFDEPGLWPPATFVGLGKEPLGRKPAKRVRLKTGERCAVHGRYQRQGADKPELILMPGDPAPFALRLGPHGEFEGREAVTWELAAEL